MLDKNCPICGKKLEKWHDSLDGWCLLEDYVGCPDGHYSHYYFTGTTEITIADKVFSYYHTARFEEKTKIETEADQYLKSITQREKMTIPTSAIDLPVPEFVQNVCTSVPEADQQTVIDWLESLPEDAPEE